MFLLTYEKAVFCPTYSYYILLIIIVTIPTPKFTGPSIMYGLLTDRHNILLRHSQPLMVYFSFTNWLVSKLLDHDIVHNLMHNMTTNKPKQVAKTWNYTW